MAHWTDYLDPRAPAGRFLQWAEVEARVRISRTTAWRLQQRGEFPAPCRISSGRVAYRERDVEAWRASRAPRGAEPPPPPKRPPAPPPTSGRRRRRGKTLPPSPQLTFDF